MYKLFIISVLFFSIKINAQKNREPYVFGKISQSDFNINSYERDSTANAMFIYEHGKTTFHQASNSIIIRTKYYAKVKIFNKQGIKNASIRIPIFNNTKRREKVINIRGITHNGIVKTSLLKDNIFREKVSDNWTEVKFTMPNVKDNSILEYEYVIESPFLFNFNGWKFQTTIPKLYSEFYALIPGNYIYNRKLTGFKKLVINESKIKKGCFSIDGLSESADCEELTYAMKNIPAFIEEDYLTSKKNYLSHIQFELSEFKGFDGHNYKYTKTWKAVDSEFKGEQSIGKQLKKVDYFKKELPNNLLTQKTSIENAKNIYYFIQNWFSWNGKFNVFKDVNVKDAYKKRVGNVLEINIALINTLKAVGYDVELMLLSTRKNGLPTKLYPVMTDFNYGIAKLNLNHEIYLLDATDKDLPFGIISFRALNSYGRVMNFKKGSYWYDIIENSKSQTRLNLNLKMDEEGDFNGVLNYNSYGYDAIRRKKKYNSQSEENYLLAVEKESENLAIESYKQIDKNDKYNFNELFKIRIESDLENDVILLNPFIINKTSVNPFKLVERSYPIDLGFKSLNTYTLQLEIPENYIVKSLPENVAFKLPNNSAVFTFNIMQSENKINLISRVRFFRSHFLPKDYPYLKEFFNQIIKTQKSLITLEKK